jgi:hypothetical protein
MDDIYNIKSYTDEELYNILDLSNPTDRELEAKILHMIWKYENFGNESGDKLVRFFKEIYDHFFSETETESAQIPIALQSHEDKPNTSATPQLSQQVSYSIDKLNPMFKETTKRLVSIDSSYRDKSVLSTDYTFNLSNPLKDVVNLRLYSIQVPYTWYTINSNFGSNFLYLKGTSSGVSGGNYDIKVEIPVGNYTSSGLVDVVNLSFQNLKQNAAYADISFGETGITYDNPSSKATIKVDMKKTYGESSYMLDFMSWTSPNTPGQKTSIPAFLGFNRQTYATTTIRSRLGILPSNANSGSDSSISRYSLTTANNLFTIYQYTGVYNTSSYAELGNIIVQLDLPTGNTYSRTQLFDNLNTQLQENVQLVNSVMNRVDISNSQQLGYGYSQYELTVQLNRMKTANTVGIKQAIVFTTDATVADNDIWRGVTSAFVFEYEYYETSRIVSETRAPQSTIDISSNPYMLLKCKKPFFNGLDNSGNVIGSTTMNDYTINLPNSVYTLSSYISTINQRIVDSSDNGNINTTNTNLTIVDSKIDIKVDINKRFREDSYRLDVSNSVFLRTVGFTNSAPIDISLNTDISGAPYNYFTYSIPTGSTIIRILPDVAPSANQFIAPYVVVNDTGANILSNNANDVSAILASIFNRYADSNVENVLAGTTIQFVPTNDNRVSAIVQIRINKYLTEKDYELVFVDPSSNDISSNSWVKNLKLDNDNYVLGDSSYNVIGSTWSEIHGVANLSPDTVELTTANNKLQLLPMDSGVTDTILITLDAGTYTREQLLTSLNTKLGASMANGSLVSVKTVSQDEYIQIYLNVNKTYTSTDYKLVFYDPYSFVRGFSGNNNLRNTSWDSTLGWVLGFHASTEYDLSLLSTITGDNVVSINMYNYFMILLDDYNHNHMNDGIVTTTKQETDVRAPSYTNRTNNRLDPVTGNELASNTSTSGTQLTQRQVYASQAVIEQKKTQTSTLKYASGPFAKNVFGLIPLKIAGMQNNSVFVETGIKDQERSYFGPVNIQRMSVKLLNDKGEIVDLNGANWSFSFICEQLYQNNRAPS